MKNNNGSSDNSGINDDKSPRLLEQETVRKIHEEQNVAENKILPIYDCDVEYFIDIFKNSNGNNNNWVMMIK